MGTASRLLSALVRAFVPPRADEPTSRRRSVVPRPAAPPAASTGDTATVEIAPPGAHALTITYAPDRDGAPDGGEVVWTWVPYEERDGRGKDRPVLVIGRRDATHSYVVRLTSKPHDGDRDYLAVGTGEWDPQARPSWVDIEQIYLVHDRGMRREAAALDRRRFDGIAAALAARYGWRRG